MQHKHLVPFVFTTTFASVLLISFLFTTRNAKVLLSTKTLISFPTDTKKFFAFTNAKHAQYGVFAFLYNTKRVA